MELHMHSHHLVPRAPDWRAAAISGALAGVVFLLVEVAATMLMGASPWAPLRMTAAIIMGQGVTMGAQTYAPTVLAGALIVHFALSVAFGLLLGAVMAPFQLDSSIGMASVAGLVFGLVLYAFDFHVMTLAFPWFGAARGQASLATHLVFGLVAADSYRALARRHENGGQTPRRPA